MFKIKLNKDIKKYNHPIAGSDLLQEIDKVCHNQYVAIKINDKIKDLSTIISYDCEVAFVPSSSSSILITSSSFL